MKKVNEVLKVLLLAVLSAATGLATFVLLAENNVIPNVSLDLTEIFSLMQTEDQPAMLPVVPSSSDSTAGVEISEVNAEPDIIPLSQEYQSGLKAIFDKYDCTSMQVAVINDGHITNTYCTGYANLANKVKVTDDTKIRVASLSKVLIGMCAMRAHQDGVLDIDGSLSEQLGYDAGNPRKPSYDMTLRDILTHTATFNETASITGRSLPNFLQDRESYFSASKPGTASCWRYSNPGIRAAGGIIEVLTGSTMHDYNKKYFFDSLDIDASFYARLIEDTNSIATLYFGDKYISLSLQDQLNRQNFDVPAGNCTVFAGGLTISAKDYAKLVCILLRDGEYNGTQYLSAESVADMEKVRFELSKFDQCTILRHRKELYGRELYYHTGVAYGVLSFAAYDPTTNEGIVVTTVGSNVESRDSVGVPTICAELAQYLFGEVLGGQKA